MAGIADAEVRLFHLYVHEPLLRSGSSGVETAEQMHAISREVLPLAGPVLDQIHQRYLQHFIEQDVVGHMEADLDGGRPRPDAGGDRVRRPGRLHAPDRGGGRADRRGRGRALRRGGRDHAARRGPGDQDDRRRGDDRRLRPGGADRLGGRLPAPADRAPAAPDRDPLRGGAVPRRRLLRARGQHRLAGRGSVGGRRGARHPSGRRLHGAPGAAPRVRADRRGQAQGLQRVDRDLHRPPGRGER